MALLLSVVALTFGCATTAAPPPSDPNAGLVADHEDKVRIARERQHALRERRQARRQLRRSEAVRQRDERITRRILAALERERGLGDVRVQTHGGIVTLRGTVVTAREKATAQGIATRVAGAGSVENQLVVLHN